MNTSVRWALTALALSMLLSSMGISIANIALPTLSSVFAAPLQEVQWVILSYLLAITTLIISVGRLGDMIGRKRVLLVGIFIYTVAAFLCGIAPTLWTLIAARAIQGVGAGILMALTIAFVSETVPKAKTGSAMGLLGTMSAIGTAAGPSLGGVLIAGFGWRAIFLVMVPIGLLNLFLAYLFLPTKQMPKKNKIKFDKLGTAILGITLAAYALAVTVGAGHFDRRNWILLGIALVFGRLFVIIEKKVPSPLISLADLSNSSQSGNLLMNTLVATVVMSTLVVGPFYLSQALGLDEIQVGLMMSISPIISILSGVPAGRIVDRWGAPSVVVFGLSAMSVGAISMATLPSIFGIIGYIISVAIMSPGYQMFQAANNTSVMANVSSDRRGVVSGMLSLSRNLGLITGASVMGAVFALASRNTYIATAGPNDVLTGMQVTFALATALILVALYIAVRIRTSGRCRAEPALENPLNCSR